MDEQPSERGLQTSWPTEPAGPPPSTRSRWAFLRELPTLIVIAFVLALLLKTFLVQAFYIPSESMEPTLYGCSTCNGDRVLVNKLVWRFRSPQRGEVVVFIAQHDNQHRSILSKIRGFLTEGLGVTTPKETDFIKRIIGLPGETIEVDARGVYITPVHGNRFKLFEPYIARASSNGTLVPCGRATDCPQGPPEKPFKVPLGSYFVMGDNRDSSADSRSSLGPVKRRDFVGKAFVKIWPLGRIGIVHVPSYGRTAQARASMPVPLATVVLALGSIIQRKRRASRASFSPRARALESAHDG
jgi:signal peptidase I